jgi:glycosyltransferase involved in cell wall biosynthesis
LDVKVALLYLNFGPYHLARVRHARRAAIGYEVCGVQMVGVPSEYAWSAEADDGIFTVETRRPMESVSRREWGSLVASALKALQPACCAIAGYSHPSMIAAINWCRRARVPIVMMSDSTAWDAKRRPWKEWVKRRIVGVCDAGFVAGEHHAEYLARLGMPRERITLGYDVVDNDYFAEGARLARLNPAVVRQKHSLPARYFLASARFIEKKNLSLLIRAYGRFRDIVASESTNGGDVPQLVILGDGPLRARLETLRQELELKAYVHLPGFIQYDELPSFYALAEALIHPSTVDQWGLVVNEAMACSLPVIVSTRCGCTSTLVAAGENGYSFDPQDEAMLADLMLHLARMSQRELEQLGQRSAQIIANLGLNHFARGLSQAVAFAMDAPRPAFSLLSVFVIEALKRARS